MFASCCSCWNRFSLLFLRVCIIVSSVAVLSAPFLLLDPLLIFRMMTSLRSSLSLMLFVESTSGFVTNKNKFSRSLLYKF